MTDEDGRYLDGVAEQAETVQADMEQRLREQKMSKPAPAMATTTPAATLEQAAADAQVPGPLLATTLHPDLLKGLTWLLDHDARTSEKWPEVREEWIQRAEAYDQAEGLPPGCTASLLLWALDLATAVAEPEPILLASGERAKVALTGRLCYGLLPVRVWNRDGQLVELVPSPRGRQAGQLGVMDLVELARCWQVGGRLGAYGEVGPLVD